MLHTIEPLTITEMVREGQIKRAAGEIIPVNTIKTLNLYHQDLGFELLCGDGADKAVEALSSIHSVHARELFVIGLIIGARAGADGRGKPIQ